MLMGRAGAPEHTMRIPHAFKRGAGQEFQPEAAAFPAEPRPGRERRATIPLYEAAEGGAEALAEHPETPFLEI